MKIKIALINGFVDFDCKVDGKVARVTSFTDGSRIDIICDAINIFNSGNFNNSHMHILEEIIRGIDYFDFYVGRDAPIIDNKIEIKPGLSYQLGFNVTPVDDFHKFLLSEFMKILDFSKGLVVDFKKIIPAIQNKLARINCYLNPSYDIDDAWIAVAGIEQLDLIRNGSIFSFPDLNTKNKELEKKYNLLLENVELEQNKLLDKYKKNEIKKASYRLNLDNIIVSSKEKNIILSCYENNLPVLLKGLSGTGKSSLVRAIGKNKKKEVVGLSFNGDTNVEHLLGHYILEKGTMIFKDGPLTDAVRNGKIFLADELNASNPEIQFILNMLLEQRDGKFGNLIVQGNNGEIIEPHKDFRFFATFNPGYIGTKNLSNSLLSRCIVVEISPLSAKKEAKLLTKKFPSLPRDIIDLIIRFKNENNSEIEYDISTRDLEQVARLYLAGNDIEDCITSAIINNCQYDTEIILLKERLGQILK